MNKGFSVVELLVIIAIVALILGISLAAAPGKVGRNRRNTISYALRNTKTYTVPVSCLNCGQGHAAEFSVGLSVPEKLSHNCPTCGLSTALVFPHLTTQPTEEGK